MAEPVNTVTWRILVADPLGEEGLALLREHAEVDVRIGLKEDELVAIISNYDALVVRSGVQVTARIIDAAKRLQVIGRAGVGTDNIDLEAATRHGILVVNAPTSNTIAAAEHTIAMMLALARHIPVADATMRKGGWDRSRFVGIEVRDKVLGLIGLGRIGAEVARRAQGLAMHVIAYDPFVSAEHAARLNVQLVDLPELLRTADFISLHTPQTAQTRGMINAQTLALVKPTARILNVARGGLIDETALLAALDEGRLAGAAIDVFPQEPPPPDSRLRSHPKVILTPHLGGSTQEAQVGVSVDVARQIIDVFEGRLAEHAVNAPLVSAETLAALVPYFDLVERLARFYAQIGEGRIEQVRLVYSGEIARYDTTPLRAAAIKGLLERVTDERINLVNAHLIARRRGLEIVEEKTTEVGHYTHLVTLIVESDRGVRKVGGILLHGEPHIVRLDDYWVDFVPQGRLLVSHNLDQPGVIGAVGTILGNANVNIAFMQVGRDAPRHQAIMIVGVDDPIPPDVFSQVLRVKALFNVKMVEM